MGLSAQSEEPLWGEDGARGPLPEGRGDSGAVGWNAAQARWVGFGKEI